MTVSLRRSRGHLQRLSRIALDALFRSVGTLLSGGGSADEPPGFAVRYNEASDRFEFDEDVYRSVEDALKDVAISAENLSTAVDAVQASLQLTRLQEDADRNRERLAEDAAERLRQLELRRRRELGRLPGRTGQQAQRSLDRIVEINAEIVQARRDAQRRSERFEEDTETRRRRAIEDALNREIARRGRGDGEVDDSLLAEIRDALLDIGKNALADAIANKLSDLLKSPLEEIAKFLLGWSLSKFVDLFKGLFDGDGAEDGEGKATLDGKIAIYYRRRYRHECGHGASDRREDSLNRHRCRQHRAIRCRIRRQVRHRESGRKHKATERARSDRRACQSGATTEHRQADSRRSQRRGGDRQPC